MTLLENMIARIEEQDRIHENIVVKFRREITACQPLDYMMRSMPNAIVAEAHSKFCKTYIRYLQNEKYTEEEKITQLEDSLATWRDRLIDNAGKINGSTSDTARIIDNLEFCELRDRIKLLTSLLKLYKSEKARGTT